MDHALGSPCFLHICSSTLSLSKEISPRKHQPQRGRGTLFEGTLHTRFELQIFFSLGTASTIHSHQLLDKQEVRDVIELPLCLPTLINHLLSSVASERPSAILMSIQVSVHRISSKIDFSLATPPRPHQIYTPCLLYTQLLGDCHFGLSIGAGLSQLNFHIKLLTCILGMSILCFTTDSGSLSDV